MSKDLILFLLTCVGVCSGERLWSYEEEAKCPTVKVLRNFDLSELLGPWYVVQYYAMSEEEVIYKCMRAILSMPNEGLEVQMNFTYGFVDDPSNDLLFGNISWRIPNLDRPAHWVHEEDTYEGVYNTYVLDSDYKEWCLLLHCAEKSKSPRYLSSLMMSRTPELPVNVISFLRDKLPRYDITLDYMFPMKQTNCADPSKELHYATKKKKSDEDEQPPKKQGKKHPLKRRTRNSKKKQNPKTT